MEWRPQWMNMPNFASCHQERRVSRSAAADATFPLSGGLISTVVAVWADAAGLANSVRAGNQTRVTILIILIG
jgi:hypothetical protein